MLSIIAACEKSSLHPTSPIEMIQGLLQLRELEFEPGFSQAF
jgi:hypothetical protein